MQDGTEVYFKSTTCVFTTTTESTSSVAEETSQSTSSVAEATSERTSTVVETTNDESSIPETTTIQTTTFYVPDNQDTKTESHDTSNTSDRLSEGELIGIIIGLCQWSYYNNSWYSMVFV